MPTPQARRGEGSAADWLALLDVVARGEVRVALRAPSGECAVVVAESELVRLEEQAARAQDQRVVLTPREREVLLRIADGTPAAEIAEELGVSASTVSQHLAAVRRKYGVSTSAEAAVRAREASALE